MRRKQWLRCLTAVVCAAMILCSLPLLSLAEDAAIRTALDQMDAAELNALKAEIDLRLRALGEYPFVKLSEGSKGDEVTALQERLKALGYFNAKPDGRYRQTTINAMKAFEKAAGLKRDGVATADDQKLLYSADAPSQPTPTPSPTPKPSPTPNREKDYKAFDYRLAALMQDKYLGNRYKVTGVILAALEGKRRLVELDKDAGLIAVDGIPAKYEQGGSVSIWGEFRGLTSYQSESGLVSVPLIKCEYIE